MVEIITREFIQMTGTAGEVRPSFCPSFVMDFWKQSHSWVNFYSREWKLQHALFVFSFAPIENDTTMPQFKALSLKSQQRGLNP